MGKRGSARGLDTWGFAGDPGCETFSAARGLVGIFGCWEEGPEREVSLASTDHSFHTVRTYYAECSAYAYVMCTGLVVICAIQLGMKREDDCKDWAATKPACNLIYSSFYVCGLW